MPTEASVVVVGAGPAGLGAALGALKAGAGDVVVLERAPDPGEQRRGETLRYDAGVEALLYPGFFDRHTRHQVQRRRYCSPSGLRHVDRTISTPNRIITWPDLMADLRAVAVERGASVELGARVVALRLGEEGVTGVEYEDARGRHTLGCGFLVGADGHDGIVTRSIGQERSRVDFPLRKLLVRGCGVDPERLEYHLHVQPGGPGGVGCVFPRGHGEAEILIMAWAGREELRARSTSGDAVQRFLERFAERHPRFAERFASCEVTYQVDTAVAMGGLIEDVVPLPRLILAGDAAGQIQARGGSGICSSLRLGHHAGMLAGAASLRGDPWSPRLAAALRNSVAQHPTARLLQRMQRLQGAPRRALFERIHSAASFDRLWPMLGALMR